MIKSLITVLTALAVSTTFGQDKFTVGISFNGSLGLATDADKTIKPFYSEFGAPNNPDLIYSRGVWNTNEFQIDFYLAKHLEVSLGTRIHNWYYTRDSTNLPYYDYSNQEVVNRYGITKRWFSIGLPTVSLLYRYPLTENINGITEASLGVTSYIRRFAENTIAYDSNHQNVWDNENDIWKRPGYSFRFQQNVLDFRIGVGTEYSFQRWSLNLVLAYYRLKYKDLKHNGLYLKGGVAFKF